MRLIDGWAEISDGVLSSKGNLNFGQTTQCLVSGELKKIMQTVYRKDANVIDKSAIEALKGLIVKAKKFV